MRKISSQGFIFFFEVALRRPMIHAMMKMQHSECHFRAGDIVTRDGSHRQRVIWTNDDDQCARDTIEVECIKEPTAVPAPES